MNCTTVMRRLFSNLSIDKDFQRRFSDALDEASEEGKAELVDEEGEISIEKGDGKYVITDEQNDEVTEAVLDGDEVTLSAPKPKVAAGEKESAAKGKSGGEGSEGSCPECGKAPCVCQSETGEEGETQGSEEEEGEDEESSITEIQDEVFSIKCKGTKITIRGDFKKALSAFRLFSESDDIVGGEVELDGPEGVEKAEGVGNDKDLGVEDPVKAGTLEVTSFGIKGDASGIVEEGKGTPEVVPGPEPELTFAEAVEEAKKELQDQKEGEVAVLLGDEGDSGYVVESCGKGNFSLYKVDFKSRTFTEVGENGEPLEGEGDEIEEEEKIAGEGEILGEEEGEEATLSSEEVTSSFSSAMGFAQPYKVFADNNKISKSKTFSKNNMKGSNPFLTSEF